MMSPVPVIVSVPTASTHQSEFRSLCAARGRSVESSAPMDWTVTRCGFLKVTSLAWDTSALGKPLVRGVHRLNTVPHSTDAKASEPVQRLSVLDASPMSSRQTTGPCIDALPRRPEEL